MAIPLILLDGASLCRDIAPEPCDVFTLRERRGQPLMAMRMTHFPLWCEAHAARKGIRQGPGCSAR